jgi:hypothetical protein
MDTWIAGAMLDVWRLLGALLGTLLLLAGSLWAGARVTEQGRALWRALRGHRAEAIAAVDETTDPLIVQLARLTTVPPEVWAAFLPAFLTALAAGLDRALGENSATVEQSGG